MIAHEGISAAGAAGACGADLCAAMGRGTANKPRILQTNFAGDNITRDRSNHQQGGREHSRRSR